MMHVYLLEIVCSQNREQKQKYFVYTRTQGGGKGVGVGGGEEWLKVVNQPVDG